MTEASVAFKQLGIGDSWPDLLDLVARHEKGHMGESSASLTSLIEAYSTAGPDSLLRNMMPPDGDNTVLPGVIQRAGYIDSMLQGLHEYDPARHTEGKWIRVATSYLLRRQGVTMELIVPELALSQPSWLGSAAMRDQFGFMTLLPNTTLRIMPGHITDYPELTFFYPLGYDAHPRYGFIYDPESEAEVLLGANEMPDYEKQWAERWGQTLPEAESHAKIEDVLRTTG